MQHRATSLYKGKHVAVNLSTDGRISKVRTRIESPQQHKFGAIMDFYEQGIKFSVS
jgi:hypothetical protein